MKQILLSFLSVFSTLSYSQVPYQVAIGGAGGEWPYSIIETFDGGLVTSGNTDSFGAGSADMYVVKTDSAGNILWTRTIGGTGFDVGLFGLQQTLDSGLIVGGYTNSYGAGGYDLLFVRLDRNGNLLWAKTVGGTLNDFGNDLIQTSDGGYCMCGHTFSYGVGGSDVYVVKLDASGNL